jgi:hypothetical protein
VGTQQTAGRTSWSIPETVAVIAGVVFGVTGMWAFAAPASFYDLAAPFDPYNEHFIRDLGAFQVGLAAVLLLATRVRDGLVVALGGTGVGSLVHTVGHVLDRDLGGRPGLDIPFLAVLSAALLAGAALRHRS